MSDIEVHVDPMNIVFARVVKICTWIGLAVMISFGLIYLMGINPYLEIPSVAENWGKPVTQFWVETKGTEIKDYSWFLSHLNRMDSLSMIGISFLALAPLVSVIAMIPKAKRPYALLLLILVAELIFSIIRPFI